MSIAVPTSDVDLVSAVHGGDLSAYGDLYQRHWGVAYRVARTLTRNRFDAEELAADAFASVLDAIRAGQLPDHFRAYLLTAVRHRAYSTTRYYQRHPQLSLDGLDFPATGSDPAENLDDRLDPDTVDATRRAFCGLLPRWRAALWLSAVEGRTPAELATRWQSSPNAMAALTCRARHAFRIAYNPTPVP